LRNIKENFNKEEKQEEDNLSFLFSKLENLKFR